MEYKLVGGSHPQDLASGRMVEPGEKVDLTADEVDNTHNAALIEAGILVSLEDLDEQSEPIATEAAVQAARDLDVNLAEVGGTGADGRITKDDVELFAAQREGGVS